MLEELDIEACVSLSADIDRSVDSLTTLMTALTSLLVSARTVEWTAVASEARNNMLTINNTISMLTDLRLRLSQHTNEYCTHEMVVDWVDITPDVSNKITYCRKCNTNE